MINQVNGSVPASPIEAPDTYDPYRYDDKVLLRNNAFFTYDQLRNWGIEPTDREKWNVETITARLVQLGIPKPETAAEIAQGQAEEEQKALKLRDLSDPYRGETVWLANGSFYTFKQLRDYGIDPDDLEKWNVETITQHLKACGKYLETEADRGPSLILDQIQPLSLDELEQQHVEYRAPLIFGLLRAGESMNIIASPKTGKSLLAANLAMSVALGVPWLGFETAAGEKNVLIIDNELHPETATGRLRKLRTDRGLDESVCKRIRLVPLRGKVAPLPDMVEYIVKWAQEHDAKVIILDALYRMLDKGQSENDNAAMTELYNTIDQIADRTGAAVVVVHHTSKGNQSEKSITDVGSGAGSISRAADTHLVLREHKEEDCVVVSVVTRSFKSPDAFVYRRNGFAAEIAPELDPDDLAGKADKKGLPAEVAVEQVVQAIPEKGTYKLIQIEEFIKSANLQIGRGKLREKLKTAVGDELLRLQKGPHNSSMYTRDMAASDSPLLERLKAFKQAHPKAHINDCADALDVHRNTVGRLLKQLNEAAEGNLSDAA